jgi:hypothetical protein
MTQNDRKRPISSKSVQKCPKVSKKGRFKKGFRSGLVRELFERGLTAAMRFYDGMHFCRSKLQGNTGKPTGWKYLTSSFTLYH